MGGSTDTLPRISVSKGRDVPGQKIFLGLVSRCPGTRAGANVPEQTPLSRPVPGQNDLKIFKKRDQIFRTSFSVLENPCSVLEYPYSVLEHPFLLCPILSHASYLSALEFVKLGEKYSLNW